MNDVSGTAAKMQSSTRCPISLSASAVTIAPRNPNARRRPRATLCSPPPSHTWKVRETTGRRGRKVDPAWQVPRQLLTAHERLHPAKFASMWNALLDTGEAGVEIQGAYIVKENLRALLASAGTRPERSVISRRLTTFYDHAAASSAPEVHRLAATVDRWWPAVLAGLETGYSNSRSED